MFKTVQQLTADAYGVVGLVTGTSVQTYTEPLVEKSIQLMFDMLYRKRFWEWLTDWHTFTLSGSGGLINADIDDTIKSFIDVEAIYISGTDRRVVRPIDREHLRVTGSYPIYYTPLPWNNANAVKRVLKFWPVGATGDVDIRARTKPDDFTPTDTVPFPSDIIAQAAAWNLLDNDGINPTAAQKAQALFDVSYQDLIASLSEDVIGHGGGRSNVPLTIRTLS